ncbi:MAG: hypothetical protein ACFB0B_03405, partial [Thermonemataceae bacterium]
GIEGGSLLGKVVGGTFDAHVEGFATVAAIAEDELAAGTVAVPRDRNGMEHRAAGATAAAEPAANGQGEFVHGLPANGFPTDVIIVAIDGVFYHRAL